MSGDSSVGNAAVYEAGDQRNPPKDSEHQERFEEGKENAHQANDSSQYSLPSRSPLCPRLPFSFSFSATTIPPPTTFPP